MSDDNRSQHDGGDDGAGSRPAFGSRFRAAGRWQVLGRLSRLTLKELRESLRDRRTIITLVVMPLLLYPLLALVFQRFLVTTLRVDGTEEYVIGIDSKLSGKLLAEQIRIGDAILRREVADEQSQASTGKENLANGESAATIGHPSTGVQWTQDETDRSPKIVWWLFESDSERRHILEANVNLAVAARRNVGDEEEIGLDQPFTWEFYYCPGSASSDAALRFVESRVRAFNKAHVDSQLRKLGVAADWPAAVTRHAVDFGASPSFSLAALIPLILVMMTVTGAVYPAIDLTAGERERGTLETLIAAPVPRLGLLLAKYVAVLTVALLTAVVNLFGMAVTSHSTGLSASLFGGAGLTWVMTFKVLMLLGLFAAFFSAVLLAITSVARSFKEAQAYIIPLMMLCLVPGVICLMPSLQFSGALAVTPLVNIVMLARDLLEGSVHPTLAAVAVFSTALYVVAAIALAARIFGSDAILYGGQATWSDILRRPATIQSAPQPVTILATLAAMFPCYFLLGNALARSPNLSMDSRLLACGLVTALVFGVIPWIVSQYNRVSSYRGIGLRGASVSAYAAAVALGLSLWPMAYELFLFGQWLGISAIRPDQFALVKHMVDEWKSVPWSLIMVALAVAPGVFEELFFRGWFFTSLRAILRPLQTILISAAVFGVFHVVAASTLAPERFLPSMFLGFVLGWVRERTGSVWPCVVMHTVHNGLLLSVTYWEDELTARGFGIEETAHLPTTWLLLAIGVAAGGAGLLLLSTRRANVAAAPRVVAG